MLQVAVGMPRAHNSVRVLDCVWGPSGVGSLGASFESGSPMTPPQVWHNIGAPSLAKARAWRARLRQVCERVPAEHRLQDAELRALAAATRRRTGAGPERQGHLHAQAPQAPEHLEKRRHNHRSVYMWACPRQDGGGANVLSGAAGHRCTCSRYWAASGPNARKNKL